MNNTLCFFSPARLTGPIFDKELRALSRRKRYYLLRIIFIGFLLLFTAWIWMMTIAFSSLGNSPVYQSMYMSTVSRSVVTGIVWLEFIVMPLLATVMLSNSISREIHKRTLEILLSTPITSLQIIMGKFLGSLLEILLLTGLTLPLFAIIRVFGGVPWDFVVISLLITFTTTCLFGAISLCASIHIRQSYRVIGWVLLWGLLIFALIPALISTLNSFYNWTWLTPARTALTIINPFEAMRQISSSVISSNPQGASVFNWGLHCLIILGTFLLLIIASTFRLRKIMLRLSTEPKSHQSITSRLRRLFNKKHRAPERKIIEIQDHPIFWKEIQMEASRDIIGSKTKKVLLICIIIIVFIIAAFFKVLAEPVFHAVFITGFALLGFLRTASLSALSISKEKQSRTWPILLTTPIEDAEIIKYKAKTIIKKTSLFWIIIAVDVIIFSACFVLNPFAIIGVAIAIIPTVLFLIGVGAYFGMRLKTTTGAIAATFLVPVVLWMLCPCSVNFSPLALIAISTGIGMNPDEWAFAGIMMAVNLIPAVVYGVAGYVFLVLTKSSMRNYIFNL